MKKFNMTKKKTALIFASIIMVCGVGITLAYYFSKVDLENALETAVPGVGIVEKFETGSQFLPGEEVGKEVKFSNTGENDALIRVKFKEDWYDVLTNQTTSCEPTEVLKEWTKYWAGKDTAEWIYGNDGWYYYTKILPAGDETNLILSSVKLNNTASNDDHAEDYSNKKYQLVFTLEASQVSNKATQELFKKSVDLSNKNNIVWSDYDALEETSNEARDAQ